MARRSCASSSRACELCAFAVLLALANLASLGGRRGRSGARLRLVAGGIYTDRELLSAHPCLLQLLVNLRPACPPAARRSNDVSKISIRPMCTESMRRLVRDRADDVARLHAVLVPDRDSITDAAARHRPIEGTFRAHSAPAFGFGVEVDPTASLAARGSARAVGGPRSRTPGAKAAARLRRAAARADPSARDTRAPRRSGAAPCRAPAS